MKNRLLILFGLVLAGLAVFAAAPANNSQTQTTTTVTVDSQYTTTWQVLDSMIVIKTDSCDTYYHGKAQVTIKPGQKLYYGLKDGAAAVVDTHILELSYEADSAETVEIGCAYVDSLRSQTDANDSIQFVAAAGGSAPPDAVVVDSIRLTGTVIDFD